MKKLILFLCFISTGLFAQTGIGTTTPDASAKLDVSSTNKGFLPPRIALTALNSASPVTIPATGLLIFNTATAGSIPNQVTPGYYYWDGVNAKWVRLEDKADNLGDHTATINVKLNGNYLSNDGGNEGIRVDNSGNVGIGTASPTNTLDVTGTMRVNGVTTLSDLVRIGSGAGDEGGEFQFAIPATNTTLQNRVNVDIWQNRLRFFEGSTNAKGVHIDLSKAPDGAAGELIWKASGLVNAGNFVQLDNIRATVTTIGNRGLSLATVSGSFFCNIGGNFSGPAVGSSGTAGTITITTTPSTSIFGWGFPSQSDTSIYIITDLTNSRAYRIILQIGGGYLNNFISIERLF
jgi:hypothetical protein